MKKQDRFLQTFGVTEAFDATTGEVTLTVIKPGLNKSGSRFYPSEVLTRDHKIFDKSKMFADHQTEAEAKARPEGSVNAWVATLKSVWAESDGTIKGKAVIVDPVFRAKVEELAKHGMLADMGVSIRAIGEATRKEVNGRMTTYVESLTHARSVDFVTYAGAGGQIEAVESDSFTSLENDNQENSMTPEQIKALQDKLTAVEAEKVTLTAENTTLKTQIAESAKTARVAVAKAEVEKQLTESKLPKLAQDRIRKQFEAAEAVDTLAQVIKDEVEYVKTISGGRVTNNGERHNGDVQESDIPALKAAQVKSYQKMGLSEAEAKIAAGV